MKDKPKKEPVTTNTRLGYSHGLAKSVGQACDVWLEKRGMKSLAWKDQKNKLDYKRRNK
tara:strand:+ start:73 stop:249 length:177 start_codon:yes stop_codon:yes gene_type:complete